MRGQGLPVPQPGRNNDFDQIRKEFDRVKEKVERLTGERGDDTRSAAAVRRSDLRTLASVELQSRQVSAAPTQADFNALQRDGATLCAAIRRISNVLGNG